MNLNKSYQTIDGAVDKVSDIDDRHNTSMTEIEADMTTIEDSFDTSTGHDHDGANSKTTAESDPIVGAINGIVKANGAGTIAAAVADTDYASALGSDDNYVTDAEKVIIGNTSGANSGDQAAGDFNHDDLANLTGTAAQYNHPTDANMTVLGNTSGANTGDMSDADVKTAYENNAETNAFTDAEKTVVGNTSNTNTGDQVISDATITTTDITTNDASAAKHGFLKKLSANAAQFMNGAGNWTTPAGAGDVAGPATNTDNNIPQWDGADSKTLKDGKSAPAGDIIGTTDTQNLSNKTVIDALNVDGAITQAGAADHITITPGTSKLVKTSVLRQDNTTNAYKNNIIILTGWGYMAGDGTAAIDEAVTFGETFAAAPIVQVTMNGAKADPAPADITEVTGAASSSDTVSVYGHTVATTGFTVEMVRNANTFGATNSYAYTWTAIGQLT